MDFKDLSYILFMESTDLQKKGYEDLSESEKVNLKLNPYAEILTPTQRGKWRKSVKKSQNITPTNSK